MVSGELYDAYDPQLVKDRKKARRLLKDFNSTAPDDLQWRRKILLTLIPNQGESLIIEPPFYCDYGENINIGKQVYFNFNCVVLDPAPVEIGDYVLIGPNVQIYTASHPLDWKKRDEGKENALPVKIGSNVWIGGAAIILPGVTIGERSVIGAGSVVTKDVPVDVFAAGNPCRVIRALT